MQYQDRTLENIYIQFCKEHHKITDVAFSAKALVISLRDQLQVDGLYMDTYCTFINGDVCYFGGAYMCMCTFVCFLFMFIV